MLTFEIEGEKQLVRMFRGMEIKGKDWKSTFKKIGRGLTSVFGGSVFTTRGAEIGERWKPRVGKGTHPLLQKTGRMRRGFKFDAKKDSLEVYNITDYFKYHQSKQPRYRLPRRIMMKLDDKRRTNIMKEFHGDLFKKLYPKRFMGQVIKW